ncbi:hypothetical protein AVDCRST_MAG82-52 [uncultured Rubrobacteraceae bacterium]|uniref:Periplasmic binding protein domain-containing protein n=1 Tax=uncultured Rubrobacteraceae bacterium TaxID=349277 RepID=A0A6J4P1J1_9ACTN|nr:hypothetical protein AVDCRST_MAG82-52 [uncultured Rubrobacteraceae bacterium]
MSAFIERVTGGQIGGATERSIRLSLSFIRLGPVIILLLLVLAMTLLSPVFLTGANISNVAVQTSVLAVLAIGQLFVILVAGIDLSVGSVLGLSTVTGAIAYAATSTYENDAILVGVDGAVEATQAIIGGDMDATVAQNPYAMGKVGVEEATRAAKGKSIDPKINTGLTLVTKENAPGYLKIREKQLGALLGVED